MKTVITTLQISLFFSLILFSTVLFAQDDYNIEVKQEVRTFSRGLHNAFIVKLPASSTKDIRKSWMKYIKDYKGSTSYDRKKSEVFSNNIMIEEMSENTIDVFAQTEQVTEDTVALQMWVNLGVDYLSPNNYPEGISVAKSVLKDFSDRIYVDLLKERKKEVKKSIKQEERDLKKLQRKKKRHNNKLERCQDKLEDVKDDIAEIEEEIDQNESAQSEEKSIIQNKEAKVESLNKDIQELKSSGIK